MTQGIEGKVVVVTGASSFAPCVLFAISQPEEVDINEIIFPPKRQES